jgi:L-lactate dehydrogenase complex protein LldE
MLMATCLADAFFADVARATVEVLEAVGCEVVFPEDQTCCGQPAFNSGDFPAAEKVARHSARVFEGELPVIVPSGSCAAMLSHGNGLLFEGQADTGDIESLAKRSWELFDFMVNGLGVKEWGGKLDRRIALHHSCHTRGSGTGAAMEALLGSIEGVELVKVGTPEQCCGFGGTFSVTFPHLSGEIGQVKLEKVLEQSPDLLVSADMSCLMHLGGLAEKQGRGIETRHAVQVLRDVKLGGNE